MGVMTTTAPDPASYRPAPGSVTMFSTPWCGYCRRLKSQLDRAGVAYREVDIEQDVSAAAVVEAVNGGNQTVPTVLFPDGSAATNPAVTDVTRRLASAG